MFWGCLAPEQHHSSPHCRRLEVRWHLSTLTVSLHPLQENIRDKLRPIPITASVEIQEPSSRRRVNSLPEVLPILNSNEAKTVQTDVSVLASPLPVLYLCYRPLPCGQVWRGSVVYAFNPGTWRQRQEVSEFKVSMTYTANSSPIRLQGETLSEKKKINNNTAYFYIHKLSCFSS